MKILLPCIIFVFLFIALGLGTLYVVRGVKMDVVEIPPQLGQSNDGLILRRYTFVPHWSIIRTATRWYDRGYEEYYKNPKTGIYYLAVCNITEYHYPIFGFGEPSTKIKNCMPK